MLPRDADFENVLIRRCWPDRSQAHASRASLIPERAGPMEMMSRGTMCQNYLSRFGKFCRAIDCLEKCQSTMCLRMRMLCPHWRLDGTAHGDNLAIPVVKNMESRERRMRITFCPSLKPILSGGTRRGVTYAQHLADRGHEVLVDCPPPRQPTVYEKIRSMVRGRGWPRQRVAGPSHLNHGTFERRVINRWASYSGTPRGAVPGLAGMWSSLPGGNHR